MPVSFLTTIYLLVFLAVSGKVSFCNRRHKAIFLIIIIIFSIWYSTADDLIADVDILLRALNRIFGSMQINTHTIHANL